jgi:transcriptional regulator with XRE-family HTH domain
MHLILTEECAMSTQVFVEVNGEKLRRLRKRRVWLIGDLAEKSGVHRNVISKLENGRGGAYPETIRRLAEALGVDPAELVEE